MLGLVDFDWLWLAMGGTNDALVFVDYVACFSLVNVLDFPTDLGALHCPRVSFSTSRCVLRTKVPVYLALPL